MASHPPAGPGPALRIEGEMTIFRAAELKRLLLDEPAPDGLDLAGVTEFDTAGLQLLLLARRESQARGRRLRLQARSAAVAEVLALAGVEALFADDGEAGAAAGGGRRSRRARPAAARRGPAPGDAP